MGFPSIIISTLSGKFKLALFFTMIEIICRYIKNLNNSCIHVYLKKVYLKSISGIKNEITYINKNLPSSEREIIFIIPHGALGVASCVLLTTFINENNINLPCYLLADNTLNNFSTMYNALCNMAGVKTEGINNKKILKLLRQKTPSVALMPGGFVEAVSVTKKHYKYYTNTYKYWIKRAIEFDYNIRIIFCLNGANFYPQSDFMLNKRIKLAKYGIPTVLPTIPKSPKLLVNDWHYNISELDTSLDLSNRIDNIYNSLCKDIEDQYITHKDTVPDCPSTISKL